MIEISVPRVSVPQVRWRERLRPSSRNADWQIAGALFLLAVVLRVVALVEIPPGLHGDEAWTGIRADDILNGTRIPAFDHIHGLGQPAGMEYLTAFFVAIFGNSTLTIRLPMALLGAATIPLTYALVRTHSDRIPALIAALLLAVMAWHLHYSRIALPPISAPFFEVLTCLLFIRGMKSESRLQIILAGAVLGLGMYSYSSYGLFVIAFGVFVAYWLAVHTKTYSRTLFTNIALMAVAALIAALPMLLFINQNRDVYFSYPRNISVFNSDAYEAADGPLERLDVIVDAGRDYVQRVVFDPEPDHSDGTGDTTMLDRPMSILLFIGMVYAVWRWKHPLAFLSLLMVVLLPWSGILTVGGGIVRRTVGVLPFITILIALPAEDLLRLTQQRPRLQRGLIAAAIAIFALIVFVDLQDYYGDFPDSDPAKYVFVPELVEASNYMDDLPEGTKVYFYSARWSIDYETRRYLAPDIDGEDRSPDFSDYPEPYFETDRSTNVAYILLDPYHEQLQRIQRLYPGGTVYEERDADVLLFAAYFLPGLQPGEEPPEPLPTFVPTATAAPQPGGDVRDNTRQVDLVRIQEALEEYRRANGEYPDNGGGVQSLCAYVDNDVGCELESVLSPLPVDPLGDSAKNGYFYSSDGTSYIVFAQRESEDLTACEAHPEHLANFGSLLCVRGP